MKINKLELAKVLAKLSVWPGDVIEWDSLPYYRTLTYIAEAERVIKALKILKKKENK